MEKEILPPALILVGERVIDERHRNYGKVIIERDFLDEKTGKVKAILCTSNNGMNPSIVFPYTERGTILLVNQFRFGTNEWTLELPGGYSKLRDDWWQTAVHELREEIGAVASKFVQIGGPMPLNPALEGGYVIPILATGCMIVADQSCDSFEAIHVKEVTVPEFRQMVRNGRITDAKTVAIGYLALDYLGLLG